MTSLVQNTDKPCECCQNGTAPIDQFGWQTDISFHFGNAKEATDSLWVDMIVISLCWIILHFVELSPIVQWGFHTITVHFIKKKYRLWQRSAYTIAIIPIRRCVMNQKLDIQIQTNLKINFRKSNTFAIYILHFLSQCIVMNTLNNPRRKSLLKFQFETNCGDFVFEMNVVVVIVIVLEVKKIASLNGQKFADTLFSLWIPTNTKQQ